MSLRQVQWRRAGHFVKVEKARRGRRARRLFLEPLFLEDRTLLTNLNLGAVLTAYDSAVQTIAGDSSKMGVIALVPSIMRTLSSFSLL
jgi:hypothetical protein